MKCPLNKRRDSEDSLRRFFPKTFFKPACTVSASLSAVSFRPAGIRAASRIVSSTFPKSLSADPSSSANRRRWSFGATASRKSSCNSSRFSENTSIVSCIYSRSLALSL